WSQSVDELTTDYIVPQESGNRSDIEWVSLSNNAGYGLFTCGDQLNFSAGYYTTKNLEEARHRYELEEQDYIVYNVDYQQNGLGSGSCSAGVLDKYQLNNNDYHFVVYCKEYSKAECSPIRSNKHNKDTSKVCVDVKKAETEYSKHSLF